MVWARPVREDWDGRPFLTRKWGGLPGGRSAIAPGLADPVNPTGVGNLEHESPLVHPLRENFLFEAGGVDPRFSLPVIRHF